MCLTKLTKDDERNALAKLPDTFPCWKVIRKDGHCRYDGDKEEPKFTRGTHLAVKGLSPHRALLDYPPSFHAYLTRPTLAIQRENSYIYNRNYQLKVVKCWADKKDIVRIGLCAASGYDCLSIAVSKITRK